MLLHVRHETLYTYDEPVNYSIQTLKLTPRADAGQRAMTWRITAPGDRQELTDPYGNLTHIITLEQPHQALHIIVEGTAEISPDIAAERPTPELLSPLAFLADTSLTRSNTGLADLALKHLGRHPPTVAAVLDLASGVRTAVAYQPGVTSVSQTAAEALEIGAGVCQDQAHVMLACCRSLGVPARYVSGYLYAGEPGEVASHAWVDVWLGSTDGWHSVDVTHCESAGTRHCRLAVGRDYLDAAPVRGVRRGGGFEYMSVNVRVTSDYPQAQQQ